MKKFALLVLTALLFAGCNNMLTNPDAFSVEEASVSMDISQLKARVATDGAVITSTLDFVGDEPKHSPFEKTQTINGSTINYTIKGLPVGSSVQFKLSVMKNGIVIFEGTSDKTTVKSKTDLKISLDKQSNWVVYYNGYNTCYGFDVNFTPITQDNISGSSNYSIDIIYDGADDQEHIADIVAYCTDDKDNAYLISSEVDYFKSLYRYNLPTKELSLIANDVNYDSPALAYDTVTDNLYVLRGSKGYYIIPNASTTNTVNITFYDNAANAYPSGFTPACKFAIYDGIFYWIDSQNYYGVCKNSLSNEIELIKESSGEYSGVLYEEIITSTEGGSVPALTDIAVTKEGVFTLLKNQESINFGGTNSASRGGVIKMNHNLTTAKLYGWTESVHVVTVTNKNLSATSRQYVPQSINDGFYGPTQILAIKPKKLIFTDIGGWAYHENGVLQTQQLKTSKNVIIFDLESCTYNSIPADLPTNDSFFTPDISNYASYNGYTCSDYWED